MHGDGSFAALENRDFQDEAIRRHGYTGSMRDYRIEGEGSDSAWAIDLIGAVETRVTNALPDGAWSLDAGLLDPDGAEAPDGFVWAVGWANIEELRVERGARVVKRWAERLGQRFARVVLDTNVYRLEVICAGASFVDDAR